LAGAFFAAAFFVALELPEPPRWDELLAATFVTVAIAVPVLLAAAAVELWVSPELVRALAGLS
jgi:ABC-type uncharacterized transport system permease subunit